ncbi:hypothetical protein I7I50_07312 [Histoplasma capsulatum G186AR]|uniref:Uncharacterized protein n=1 Tax=Ajellomyces capsulatus TaxID=5037 RepID=A0A8H7Z177_AJECA|nr:hypothetical protein I7I52_09616 [Histoplasma capsulatum]QSS68039.1 hypothetical protein I7I50_07312 [Histoplasma capsulatum G186AR]
MPIVLETSSIPLNPRTKPFCIATRYKYTSVLGLTSEHHKENQTVILGRLSILLFPRKKDPNTSP